VESTGRTVRSARTQRSKEIPADELFEKLKPFQRLVEDDLEHADGD
jgi:hypothetical protein